jgi:hypothetical protein
MTTYSGGSVGVGHPIAWCRQDVEGGRRWYTEMGHTVGSYSEPLFVCIYSVVTSPRRQRNASDPNNSARVQAALGISTRRGNRRDPN